MTPGFCLFMKLPVAVTGWCGKALILITGITLIWMFEWLKRVGYSLLTFFAVLLWELRKKLSLEDLRLKSIEIDSRDERKS